jgi:hypothetical protein
MYGNTYLACKTSPQPLSKGEGPEPLTRKSLKGIIKFLSDNNDKITLKIYYSQPVHISLIICSGCVNKLLVIGNKKHAKPPEIFGGFVADSVFLRRSKNDPL